MAKILIVEDENEIREIEKDYLHKSGYEIVESTSGTDAITKFNKESIDLVVLDLNLPGMDGIEVCKKIRSRNLKTPIIMVTARTKEIDELIGLEIGADDYLKKPFSPKILVARVNSLLRKLNGESTQEIKIDNLSINLKTFEVHRDQELLPLTTIQINILWLLMNNTGKVFSREELIDRSYDTNIPPDIFDRTVDSHIKNIRKIIETDSKNPEYIITVRGKGYKFKANPSPTIGGFPPSEGGIERGSIELKQQ